MSVTTVAPVVTIATVATTTTDIAIPSTTSAAAVMIAIAAAATNAAVSAATAVALSKIVTCLPLYRFRQLLIISSNIFHLSNTVICKRFEQESHGWAKIGGYILLKKLTQVFFSYCIHILSS